MRNKREARFWTDCDLRGYSAEEAERREAGRDARAGVNDGERE